VAETNKENMSEEVTDKVASITIEGDQGAKASPKSDGLYTIAKWFSRGSDKSGDGTPEEKPAEEEAKKEDGASIPDVEDDTKSAKDPVMEKKAEDEKRQEHVPEKTASIPDMEDDTKSVKDPVMEKTAEDEKKREHVPEKNASIPDVEDDTKSAKDPVMEKKAEAEKKPKKPKEILTVTQKRY